ncbi:unnamed protein product [Prunus brigantina]
MCRFIGYPKETLGYYFYHPNKQKVVVARFARFLEIDFALDGTCVQKVELNEKSGEPHEPELESDLVDRDDIKDPKTYTKAILDIDSTKWQEAMKSEMDSMYANQVWTLVDPPEGIVLIGNKWVFKRKKGLDGKVKTYKARLASRSWNIHFDESVKGYGFSQNEDKPCVYKKNSGSAVVFLVLYVDDILMFGKDIDMFTFLKLWLSNTFSMKDLGNASYILGIKIYRDRSRKLIGLSQSCMWTRCSEDFKWNIPRRVFCQSDMVFTYLRA